MKYPTLSVKNKGRKTLFIALFLAFSLFSTNVNASNFQCINNTHLRESFIANINGDSIPISFDMECQFGCINESYISLGYSSCRESEILLLIISVLIIIAFILLMRWLLK